MLSVHNCTATLQHLIAATLAPGRGVSANELLGDLTASDDLKDGAATLDSLDQLTAASQVADFFELEKAGTEQLLLRRNRLNQWSEVIAEGLNDGSIEHLWFRSGGTTGEPKRIAHALHRLRAEAVEISHIVSDTRRIVSLVPLQHIYGFIWGPLLSDQINVPLIHGPEAIDALHGGLQSGDLLLGVPEWWQYVGRLHQPLPAGVTGVTSTAPCPPAVIRSALEKGIGTMVEVYGSSETAGIGWRDDTEQAFRLFAHWHKHDGDHLRSDTGEIYALPDRVHWHTDHSLTPGQRRDNAIQVGGVNVWPERVRTFIESHARVQACSVRPLDTGHGTRLKAFIVPTDRADETLEPALRDWLKRNLAAAERPVQLTVGADLPRNPMGKLCDW